MVKARGGFVVICLVVLFGLSGCSLFTTTIDESDVGSIQRLDVGDLLVIRLIGNATTGYEWDRTVPVSFVESPVEIVEEGGYQTSECQMVGAQGEFIFRYRAMRPGTVVLGFEYRKPWEANDPIDSYAVTVWVR
jgi:predicted secreted protein